MDTVGRTRGSAPVGNTLGLSTPAAIALIAPLVCLIGLLFLGPLVSLVLSTVRNSEGGYRIYRDVLSDDVVRAALIRTFEIGLECTAIAVVVGYATAYLMWRSGPRLRSLLLMLVLFPLFTSVIVRTYAWSVVLSRFGILNTILTQLHLINEPLSLMGTKTAVLIGMIQVLLPFVVLPVLNSFDRIDPSLLRASAISGANALRTFRSIVLPLTLTSVLVAAVLALVLALGFFVTPVLLGGPQATMITNLIDQSVQTYLDLPRAATEAVILLVITLVVVGSLYRWLDFRRVLGGAS